MPKPWLLFACAAVLGCGPGPAPPNLLVIVSDTLRADVLACYGGRARTPNICGLAERGARFENAIANGPWTPPSSVALLTGNLPGVYAEAPLTERSRVFHVPEEEVLLAEVLGEAGYQVVGDVENEVATRSQALQGIERLETRGRRLVAEQLGLETDSHAYRRLSRVLGHLLGGAHEPFFVLAWMLDPHAPYQPPPHLLDGLEARIAALPQPLEYYTSLGHRRADHRLRVEIEKLSKAERAFVFELYLREVEFVDERVGWILRSLEVAGLADRTLVVFTSDHGEGFGEHDVYLHGRVLYDELVRIPLIVAGPGVAPGTRDATVSLVDLAPTLADWAGVSLPGPRDGRSFAEVLRGGPAGSTQAYVSHATSTEQGVDAIIEGPFKLVLDPDGEAHALFDRSRDPDERDDVAADEGERVAKLKQHALRRRRDAEERRSALRASSSEEKRARTEAETLESLRALGYVE